ncbi:LysR family transcriptional regulator [Clostridium sp. C105KSO13]|uniref:LysR family transcriptional regulator n=1 Tax=Clostridium sp. C105KSO13 TaxID=1776045 RepID=UPI000740743C|nr:LysR family transcriptional regulator [Clostridium sp. C105KSO13]CUX47838.1 Hca operon transcriptional activator [Clostridium sp. C105KSO13]
MKLSQLRYFKTICKYNNITRASNELHVSQPSLSNVIKDLEDEFGVTLFYRLSKGLILTKEGTLFLDKASDILEQADALISEMTAMGNTNPAVNLGLPPMVGSLVFPDILANLQEAYPNTRLSIIEHGSLTNKSMVTDGTLDAAIISSTGPLSSALNYIDICNLDVLFYTSIENPIACMTEINFEQLRNIPLVLLNEDSFITSFVVQHFRQYNLQPNILFHTDQLHTIQKLVDNNTASTFLYDGTLSPNENIVSISLSDCPNIRARLIWNKNRKQKSGMKNLINFMHNRSESRQFS